jgi:hypothetical protein
MKLDDHPFFKQMAQLMAGVVEASTEEDAEGNKKTTYSYDKQSDKNKYILDVFEITMRLHSTIEQLLFVPAFLKRFPIRKFYEENNINHPKYLQYHLEVHFIKASTVLDLMANIINETFRLGIPHKRCTVQSVSENKHTKETSPAEIIKKYDKAIQGIKTARNQLVHHGNFEDEEIKEIAMYHFLKETEREGEEAVIPESTLKYFTKTTVKKKVELASENNKEILKIVEAFFNEISKVFNRNLEAFKEA